MPAPGPEPERVGDDDDTPWPHNSDHFVGHGPRLGHVLEDVGRVGKVKGAIHEGQRRPACLDRAWSGISSMQAHLPRISIHRDVCRPARGEGIREESWAAADIEQEGTSE